MWRWQLVSFVSFLFFIWLLLRLLASYLFWLYLWQRKEYRWDRWWAHLKLPDSRQQVIAALNPFVFLVRKPQLTLRVGLIFWLTMLIDYQLYFYLLRFLSVWVRQWPILLFPIFTLNLLLVFWLTPGVMIFINVIVDLLLKPIYWLLLELAKFKLLRIKPLVIGITGSFAKTATKQILYKILSVQYKVLATDSSVNTPLGIAKTILTKLKPDHEIFIVEMGAYRPGEIKQLAAIVKPKVGILTGINPQHTALFGSKAKIVQTKYELIQALPHQGLAVFNGENPLTAHLAKRTHQVKVKVYHYPPKPYQTKLLGRFQQLNIQGVLTVADYLGVNRVKALEVIEQLLPTEMFLKTRRGLRDCLVLDDSHNANPDGFWEALMVLEKLPAKQKIVITAGIIELGKAAGQVHRRLGKRIAAVADRLILTSHNFATAFAAGAGGEFSPKTEVILNKTALESRLKKLIDKETIILLEGWNWQARKILFPKE